MGQTVLIIVESPTKAKKIAGYLGAGYVVKASMGHIADLPVKGLAVDMGTYEEAYEVRNADKVKQLRADVAKADRVLLASDPDREGEAIAWHLARELKLGRKAERIEFHAITPEAVRHAVANPRPIDMARVDAQRARRVLDRLVGYQTSEAICWPAGAKSAGRVQTPALHLLCDLERRIQAFRESTYWVLAATYANGIIATAPASDNPADGAREDAADGEVSEEAAEAFRRAEARRFASEEEALAYKAAAERAAHRVASVLTARTQRTAGAPYITSTCYQDAKRKLNLSTEACAAQLQTLFEEGLITYHRTDSTRVDPAFVAVAREYLAAHHPNALSERAPAARTKAGAQDAHEAIRPTRLEDVSGVPNTVRPLYDMIRARFLASQCRPAVFDMTQVTIEAGETSWVADGRVMVSPGFLEIWGPYAQAEDTLLPPVKEGESLDTPDIACIKRKTAPPPRYDDATLTKRLESAGIGRPSTFASIIATLCRHGYAEVLEGKRNRTFLAATPLGLQLDDLLTTTMPNLVTEEYTAAMEAALDRIADAEAGDSRVEYLRSWHAEFTQSLQDAGKVVVDYVKRHNLQPQRRGGGGGEPTTITCDRCGTQPYIKLKSGDRPFLKCEACEMLRPVRAKTRKGACAKCKGTMIEYTTKDGKQTFWACANARNAKAACDYKESTPGQANVSRTREETGARCPGCRQGTLAKILKPDGTGFLGCNRREACRFMADLDARVRRDACPDCRGDLVRRMTKVGKPFWSCANYPGCRHAEDFKPTEPGEALAESTGSASTSKAAK